MLVRGRFKKVVVLVRFEFGGCESFHSRTALSVRTAKLNPFGGDLVSCNSLGLLPDITVCKGGNKNGDGMVQTF